MKVQGQVRENSTATDVINHSASNRESSLCLNGCPLTSYASLIFVRLLYEGYIIINRDRHHK